jgi:hypothetical protein
MADPLAGAADRPSTLVFHYVLHQRMCAAFPPGARVLNLGAGGGHDAVALASAGLRVLGLDPSPEAAQRARRRALAAGVASRVRFEVRAPHELRLEDGIFDGACAGFGGLDGADLPVVGRALAAVLRPGAPLVLSLRAPRPAAARYRARSQAQEALGPEFEWTRGFGLGVTVPGDAHASWTRRHPQAFGALAALDGLVREWPIVRDLGAHLVLEGRRR